MLLIPIVKIKWIKTFLLVLNVHTFENRSFEICSLEQRDFFNKNYAKWHDVLFKAQK